MYLKFDTKLKFPDVAKALCPELTEADLAWDYENVYEWMYIDLPQLDFSLNSSRRHGWADVGGELNEQILDSQEFPKQVIRPGPIYVFGWDRKKADYVDQLPDCLPSFIADRLSVDVSVFDRRINVDVPDGQPLAVVSPKLNTGS